MSKKSTAQEQEQTQEPEARKQTGKGRPTPKRKEAEALNRKPLIVNDRKEARRRAREERERQRAAMLAGDERYLPVKERGPQKKFAREIVDARFNVGELLLPLMFVIVALVLVQNPAITLLYTVGLWAFMILLVLDCLWVGRRVRRRAAERFGKDNVERGLGMYAATRAMQSRGMRVPKPQEKRPLFGLLRGGSKKTKK